MPTRDNRGSNYLAANGPSCTITGFTVGSGANRFLVATFENIAASSNHCTAVTYGGVSLDLLGTYNLTGSVCLDVYYKKAPASGTADVVFTLGPSNIRGVASVVSFADVDQTSPMGTPATAGPTFNASPTVTVTDYASGDLLMDCSGCSWATGRTCAAGADQTEETNSTNTDNSRGMTSSQPGTAGGVMSWTLSASSNWAMVAFALKAAAAGPQTVNATAVALTLTVATPTITPGALTITATAAALTLTANAVSINGIGGGVGEALAGRTVTWSSSSPGVVAAPASGVTDAAGTVTPILTLLSAGTTNLQAHCEGVDSNIVPITVTTPVLVATVEVTPTSLSGQVGGYGTLTAVAKDGSGNPLTGRAIGWSTSNAGVAAPAAGHGNDNPVTVYYLSASGTPANLRAWCEGIGSNVVPVTVSAASVPVASVTVAPTSLSGQVGGAGVLTATPKDGGGTALTGRRVDWRVSNVNALSATTPGATSTVGYLATPGGSVTANCEGIDSNSVPVTVSAATGTTYPNQPTSAGWSPIVEWNASVLPPVVVGSWVTTGMTRGMMNHWEGGPGNLDVVSVSDDRAWMQSPPSALRTTFAQGMGEWAPGAISFWKDGNWASDPGYTEFYLAYRIRLYGDGTDFDFHSVGNKHFYFSYMSSAGRNNHSCNGVPGHGLGTSAPYGFAFAQTSDLGDDIGHAGLWQGPNIAGAPNLQVGAHGGVLIEHYIKMNSLANADPCPYDGGFKIWINGQLTHWYGLGGPGAGIRFRSVKNPKGIYLFRWDPVFGGNVGETKSQTDYIDIDHIFAMGRYG